MMQKIITVDETFVIQDRGLVVTGLKEENWAEIKSGDLVEVIRPNNTTVKSKIAGVEFIKRKNLTDISQVQTFAFLLKDLTKEDVPKGSVINLLP